MTAKEFEAEFWTDQDPQDRYSFAEAYAAHLGYESRFLGDRQQAIKDCMAIASDCEDDDKTAGAVYMEIKNRLLREEEECDVSTQYAPKVTSSGIVGQNEKLGPTSNSAVQTADSGPSGNAVCKLCGKPMPEGEEMFNYHGYSGPCPEN